MVRFSSGTCSEIDKTVRGLQKISNATFEAWPAVETINKVQALAVARGQNTETTAATELTTEITSECRASFSEEQPDRD